MEREQEKRRKIERKKGDKSLSLKVEYTSKCWRGTMTTDVIVSSSAEEARDPVVGTNRACSNRRSEEYKYGCSISETAGRYMP